MKILVLVCLIILFGTYAWRKKTALMYIIVITLLSTLFVCFCHSLFMAVMDFDFSGEWLGYNFFFTFIVTVFPIMISVIIFKSVLKKYIVLKNLILRFSIQFLVLLFIIQSSFVCWAITDMQFFDFNYEYTLPNILNAYKSNYLIFVPISFLIPVSIIYFDSMYEKRLIRNKKAALQVGEGELKNKS